MSIYDWIFAISAVLFNLLIAGIFISQKYKNENYTKILGVSWLLLFFPLGAVFFNFGRSYSNGGTCQAARRVRQGGVASAAQSFPDST